MIKEAVKLVQTVCSGPSARGALAVGLLSAMAACTAPKHGLSQEALEADVNCMIAADGYGREWQAVKRLSDWGYKAIDYAGAKTSMAVDIAPRIGADTFGAVRVADLESSLNRDIAAHNTACPTHPVVTEAIVTGATHVPANPNQRWQGPRFSQDFK